MEAAVVTLPETPFLRDYRKRVIFPAFIETRLHSWHLRKQDGY
jgi:hypothetical protein